MNLGTRLKARRKELGLTQTALAEKIGVSQNAIQKIEAGGDTMHLIKLAEALKVDPIWLSTGKGESNPVAVLDPDEMDDDEVIIIDVLDVEASAGAGCHSSDMVEIVSQVRYVPEQYHQTIGLPQNNIRIISAKGDSMHPKIQHGDMLYVDISITYFDGDGIYIFNYDNHNYVKRLQKAGKVLRVISDNKELYPDPWTIEGEEMNEVFIIGKVKGIQNQKLEIVG
ncbi:hypothetical protein A1D22_05930 [Pasteurellaceae bacterium LFhippo2]|nr:hypothetical protein [Pasteurellaceae bacterium LFhippo2]